MVHIIRGTTPTITVKIKNEDIDLANVAQFWLYIYQTLQIKIDKTITDAVIDAEEKTVTFRLSQQNTLALSKGQGIIQIRLLMDDDSALATYSENIEVDEVYKGGVIS